MSYNIPSVPEVIVILSILIHRNIGDILEYLVGKTINTDVHFVVLAKEPENFTIQIRNDHLAYSCMLWIFSWSLLQHFERYLSIDYWLITQQLLSISGYYLVCWCLFLAPTHSEANSPMNSSRNYEQGLLRVGDCAMTRPSNLSDKYFILAVVQRHFELCWLHQYPRRFNY